MKTTLTTTEAAHRLIDDKNANWTWDGALALVEYLEELEEDTGEEIEFCPVAIRCDYSQYADLEDWALEQWGSDNAAREALDCEDQDQDVIEDQIREYIRDRGTLLEFAVGIIVSSF